MAATWRQRQAAATRQQILQSARALFGSQGYGVTSIEAIAEHAAVATPTVYKAFGSKRAIARELNDLIDTESGVAALARQAMGQTDPARLIADSVHIGRCLQESCGDLIAAVHAAAGNEPEIADVLAEGMRRHVQGNRGAAARLQESGALRGGLTVEHAAGLLGQLSSAETFAALHEHHGWTYDECDRRLTEAACALLLSATVDEDLGAGHA